LDPRIYILYAYAQKYLGYPGSLGEFLSDCTILFFKERGVEVALKLPEATWNSPQPSPWEHKDESAPGGVVELLKRALGDVR
jgi:hypothetical protein